MEQKKADRQQKKLWHIILAFGLNLFFAIYISGFILGKLLDEKLNTSPLFLIAGVLIGLAASFYRLFHQLYVLEKQDKNEENSQ